MSIIRESAVHGLIRFESVDKSFTLARMLKDGLNIDSDTGIEGDYYVSKVDMCFLGNNEYSCSVTLEGKWELMDNFSLGSMKFIVKYDHSGVKFTFKTEFKLNNTTIEIEARRENKSWILSSNFDGQHLELTLTSEYTRIFYKSNSSVNIKKLIQNFSEDVALTLPDDLEVKLENINLIHKKGTKELKDSFLISMQLAVDLDLSKIDFLSEVLPDDFSLKMSQFTLLYSSSKLSSDTLKTFNANLPTERKISMPKSTNENTEESIEQGLTLGANFELGGKSVPISYLFSKAEGAIDKTAEGKEEKGKSKALALPSDKGVKWIDLDLELGPLKISRLGFSFKDSKLFILINASVEIGAVKFMLIGLGAGSSLTKFDPTFALSGLALEIKTATVEVSGLLYKDGDTYSGAALIKTASIALSAIASYQSKPFSSLFLYARADFTPVGPVFFMVDGLTVGLGINRDLILPKIDKIAEFPLVSYAMLKDPPSMEDALSTLEQAKESLPPMIDKHFICFGIKFSSFKIIDSFALVTLSFAKEVEVNLIGMSKLEMPPKIKGMDETITPIALVKMGFMATYLPKKGELCVRAKILPGSYIFSEACILTGGFAFSSWFTGEHTGDFVLTLGGYHPNFNVPKHYPRVEPVALNWKISDALKLKGSIYFALCPHAIMAGAHLEASYASGNVRAWFFAVINLLLAWKPFHYEANLRIEVGGSYTMSVCVPLLGCARKTLSVSVGARLEIWGPDFAGKAIVDLGPIGIKISFGDASSKSVKPIEWDEFRKTFLPNEQKDICKIVIKDGMIRTIDKEEGITVVNPGSFLLSIDGLIPNHEITVNDLQHFKSTANPFGIAPMNVRENQINTEQKIEILLDGKKLDEAVSKGFRISQNNKNMPTGLWGESTKVSTNDKHFIKDALSGVEIQAPLAKSGVVLKYEISRSLSSKKDNAFIWNDFKSPSISLLDNWDDLTKDIKENSKRQALSEAFSLGDIDFSSNKKLSDWYVAKPNIVTYT